MAEAETEMVNRGIDAREGAQFQIREARQQRDRALTDIGRRRTTLANEKGLFVNDLLSQLIGEDRTARAQAAADAQDRGIRMLNAGIDPTTGAPIPGGKLDKDGDGVLGGTEPKKKKWLTQAQMQTQGAEFSRAQEIARTMLRNAGGKPSRKLRESIGKALLAGRGAVDAPIYDPSTGARRIDPKTGEQVTRRVPAQKPVDPHIATAALDMVMLGRLSPGTVTMLRSLGVRVKQLPGAQFGPRQNQARPVGADNKAPF
jgi:hypothetical protein